MHRATTILYGDAAMIQASKYDLILANINRNILLEDMSTYARGLKCADEIKFRKGMYKGVPAAAGNSDEAASLAYPASGSLLVLSGFYTEDVPLLKAEAEKQGLQYVSQMSKDNWCAVCFCKR